MPIDLNIGQLAEPITKLIDVVSKGIGRVYEPTSTIRQAEADAKAKIILARADIEVTSLQQRAAERNLYREQLRQENIEQIVSVAKGELPRSVSNEPVSKDWVLQFFETAQDVCDKDLQGLWAKILAGEVSSPGRYSKRTLQFLKTLDKTEAERFTELCAFAFVDEDGWHFIFDNPFARVPLSKKFDGQDFYGHFVAIGLLSPREGAWPVLGLKGKKVGYFDRSFELRGRETPSRIARPPELIIIRGFTQVGQELANIAGAKPEPGFIEDLQANMGMELTVRFDELPRPDAQGANPQPSI